jgi:hypothetical protein
MPVEGSPDGPADPRARLRPLRRRSDGRRCAARPPPRSDLAEAVQRPAQRGCPLRPALAASGSAATPRHGLIGARQRCPTCDRRARKPGARTPVGFILRDLPVDRGDALPAHPAHPGGARAEPASGGHTTRIRSRPQLLRQFELAVVDAPVRVLERKRRPDHPVPGHIRASAPIPGGDHIQKTPTARETCARR